MVVAEGVKTRLECGHGLRSGKTCQHAWTGPVPLHLPTSHRQATGRPLEARRGSHQKRENGEKGPMNDDGESVSRGGAREPPR